ncbi:unnamed protein product [Nezara viridula]|uniref:Uncharacterized protein n=1 Tax=Nezara viridula TaxID=85310 RepID=A0A9P0H741_NEZVI|nr:unnamed protein product [Nezara viridula]
MMEKEIRKLGNTVGSLLESLPIRERGRAIRDIQNLEEHFSNNLDHHRGDSPKLSTQLLRIEMIRMVPRLDTEPNKRWPHLPRNYSQAVNFLSRLPLPYQIQALKKINEIAKTFALYSCNPKAKD